MARHDPRSPKRRSGRLRGWRGKLVLLAFSMGLSALVLGAIEGACRLGGYGGYASTFAEVSALGDGAHLVITDHAGPGSYFFSRRSRPGSLDPTAFEIPKPAGTVRIIFAGGSAAKGSPWPRHLAAASFLEQMLGDCWPDRQVEVINIGTTAIASFPVLGMVIESLRYDPDLVVAYLGNNEYYGAYGVASLHNAGRSPTMIRLIRAVGSLGVAQFIDSKRRGYDTSDPRTLMEAMVGRASIGADDPARAAAARNLEAFVGEMVSRCTARGVPIIVCPPPCNEVGLAPLGTPDHSSLSELDRERLASLIAGARSALDDDRSLARESALEAVSIATDDATAHYVLGEAYSALGESSSAAEEFRAAVDLDPMPWRPPSASVEAVRRAGEQGGAIVCDLPRAFREASPGGVVGWGLMADHVHPSLKGQALIARTIVDSMSALPAAVRVDPEAASRLPSWEVFADRLGASVYDEYAAAHAMRTLGKIPFFADTNPEFFGRFDLVCSSIEAGSSPAVVAALHAWQDPASHKGEWRPITGMVAQALFARGDLAHAEPLFEAARRAVTPYGSWELQYAAFGLICRASINGGLSGQDRALAERMIGRGRFIIDNGWSTTGAAERYTGEMLAMLGRHDEAIGVLSAGRGKQPEEGKVAVDGDLVASYLAKGRIADAERVALAGLEAGGRYSPYYAQMLEQVRAARGRP